jgi:predicted transposase/invertase (TIGR01784 family)
MLAEKNPQIAKAVGRLQELTEDERERLLAESREKWEWDMQAIREDGIKKGLEKGREEGIEKGIEKGLLSVATAALKKNLPIEDIMALTGLSREKIQSLPH